MSVIKPYEYLFVRASFLFYWCTSMCLLKVSLKKKKKKKSPQGMSFEHKFPVGGEREALFS